MSAEWTSTADEDIDVPPGGTTSLIHGKISPGTITNNLVEMTVKQTGPYSQWQMH